MIQSLELGSLWKQTAETNGKILCEHLSVVTEENN